MEGKEVRFGIFNSALFATITTDASCGAVNSMHDSFTALGGFVPLFNIQLGEIIFGGVGAIALLVAAIGIANTMAMSILERTREIGLMKAVGATNRDVLSIFLGEAAGIGFLGGVGGVIVGWLAAQAINVIAIIYLAGQAISRAAPPSVAVYTPIWLLILP
jgi:ABC-type antimicrobial peptide transport system permease subunit